MRHQTANKPSSLGIIIVTLILIAGTATWGFLNRGDWPQSSGALSVLNSEAVSATSDILSNIDHGETLAEVMDGIRSEDFEVTAAFTADGVKLFEYTDYSSTSVEVTDAHARLMRRQDKLIFVHNHPVWDEAPFSSSDLEKLVYYDASVGVVVSKADTYVIMPRHGWPAPNQISDFIREHSDLTATIWFQGVDGTADDVRVTTKKLLELVAEEFDLCYYEWDNSIVTSAEVAAAILDE